MVPQRREARYTTNDKQYCLRQQQSGELLPYSACHSLDGRRRFVLPMKSQCVFKQQSYSHKNTKNLVVKIPCITLKPLMGKSNYSAASNNMKLVDWSLMGGHLPFTYGTARRGQSGAAALSGHSSLYQM